MGKKALQSFRRTTQNHRTISFVVKRDFPDQIRNMNDSDYLVDLDEPECNYIVASYVILFYIYLGFALYYVKTGGWLPAPKCPQGLSDAVCLEKIREIYIERCSPYSTGHAFLTFISGQCGFGAIMILLQYILFSCACASIGPFPLYTSFSFLSTCLFLIMGSHICMELASVFTCRPIEVLYDIRFTSMLAAQLFSFIGCLLIAYKLGSMFSNKRSRHVSLKKPSLISS